MLGVIANPVDHDVIRELFELFKTPWEFHRPGRSYDVVICGGGVDVRGVSAGVVVDCGAAPTGAASDGGCSAGRAVVRVGYDLFRAVRIALTDGQPIANAGVPSVDLHIARLRDLILHAAPAVPFVEIPPAPVGYPFIACLTHDLDHPSIRRHAWDHTMVGFLYRALVGSVHDVLRGRGSLRRLLTNWAAALRLPLVHAGLARDFWADFDRYVAIDAGVPSTFFVIPFAGVPGRTPDGAAPARRAARYGARDIGDRLRQLRDAGCEIGVHGIDAWHDSEQGARERDEVAGITGASELGVRMHWLYGGADAAATLEKAGFAYDSTSGYNETVGYRAGTTQVFKPLDAVRLLELPLHIMDTALFYPRHLDLSPSDALLRVHQIVEHVRRLGGTVTVNWHDRSLAPERLWGATYAEILHELTAHQPWFATAGRAVAWFRKRRSVVFESVRLDAGALHAKVETAVDGDDDVPALRLRVYPPRRSTDGRPGVDARYVDVPIEPGREAVVEL
jgi:hypothetical protein